MINTKKNLYECVIITSQYSDIENIISFISEEPELKNQELIEQNTSHEKEKNLEIIRKESWGRRALAYKINSFKKAEYHVIYFYANSKGLSSINKRLRMCQNVIRFLNLKIKELPIKNPPISAQAALLENV